LGSALVLGPLVELVSLLEMAAAAASSASAMGPLLVAVVLSTMVLEALLAMTTTVV
jgi:hypothetical protein